MWLLKTSRKHIWRRLKIGSEFRPQVSEDSCRASRLQPSFYLRILLSYRVTSSELQRILFLDYTQRGILFPSVKIRWHLRQQSGSCRTWGLLGEQSLCDSLLDDSAEKSFEGHHSAWQQLRGCSRGIAIDFLFRKQQKASTHQARLLKIHLRSSYNLSPNAEARYSFHIIQEHVQTAAYD